MIATGGLYRIYYDNVHDTWATFFTRKRSTLTHNVIEINFTPAINSFCRSSYYAPFYNIYVNALTLIETT
jgi:hypothetical protein